MPERYDRSVCASELLLRNTIVNKIVNGWTVAPSFHLPQTAQDAGRIGKVSANANETLPPETAPTLPVGSEVSHKGGDKELPLTPATQDDRDATPLDEQPAHLADTTTSQGNTQTADLEPSHPAAR